MGKVVKVRNAASAPFKVRELIVKQTTLQPGEELELDPNTQIVEIAP